MRVDYSQLSAAFDLILKALSLSLPLFLSISFTQRGSPLCAEDELRKGLYFSTARSSQLTSQSVCLCVICVQAFHVSVTQLSVS